MAQRKRRRSSQAQAALVQNLVVPRYEAHFSSLFLPSIPNDVITVLDVSCGTGHISERIAATLPPHASLIGLDPDAGLVEEADRNRKDARIQYLVGAAEHLEFEDESFDLVVGNLAVPTFEDAPRAMREIRRVLRPGCVFFLTSQLEGSWIELFDMFDESAVRRTNRTLRTRVHAERARDPGPDVLRSIARDAGFLSVQVEETSFPLTFESAHSMIENPLVQHVCKERFVRISDGDPEPLLAEAARSLDTYAGGGPIAVSIHAGMVTGVKA